MTRKEQILRSRPENLSRTNCEKCGISFLSITRYGKRKFCSQGCSVGRKPKAERGLIVCKTCGKEFDELLSAIKKSGRSFCTQSCAATNRFTKHGLSRSKFYRVWDSMICRCYNKKNPAYKYYGKRGIKVCDEWKNDFMAFYNWIIGVGYIDGLTIDRINNNGNYEPSNCKLATRKEQMRNQRRNNWIEYDGKKMLISDWAKKLNLSGATMYRWSKKYSYEEIKNKIETK